MTATTMAVKVDGLTKTFETAVAVEELSFEVRENEFVTVVGPSGCGKSTMLRMVSGLVPPTKGRVYLRGRVVDGPIADVGMVFQSPVLLPWRNAIGNVLFTAEMRGRNTGEYRQRALELIRLASLEGFEQRYPFELSGGMQQRVAICRALLLNPSLLLMDEPFGALDIMTREKMGFELQKIWTASRTTVLFVTHSITEAVLLSDTIIVMTARPGKAKAVIPVDLPRPRDAKTLRDPRFVELAATVRDNIEAQWVE
ncbi:MAG TPA: ABC transporter ATP-binding protein [Candidatus Methylomirabilis sp.]|nr:ABC transporter ATP-binding protein [Candidatus Methylomirabilis sp.]HSC72087.1 ABC transporter ATP-binding protein [Candidatus Methylomirabilis sp.]